jgi:hypothetical protein
MSSIPEPLVGYDKWYQSAGFAQTHREAINEGRRRFHASTDRHTKMATGRIAQSVITLFTTLNALIERWPAVIRRDLNQSSCQATQPTVEFDTWARPRDLEKRKQALSVWTSLLAFLVFHWHQYGTNGALESMGLELTWQLKDWIDAIHDYAESGCAPEALAATVKEFFAQAVMDTSATPKTNLLLWWLAVLIQTEVLDNQPRWYVAQLLDNLEFPQKLEAIDHYARSLVLECSFYQWINDTSPVNGSQAQKEKVVQSLDRVPLDWVEQDRERPPVDFRQEALEVASAEWQLCTAYIRPILVKWLRERTVGPMSVVIELRRGGLVPLPPRKHFGVKMKIYEDYTTDPRMSVCYPALVGTWATIKQANKAARECLQEELGPKQEARKWDEVYETGGRVRIRAIYRDDANDAKAIAWVEELSMDEGLL